MEKIIDLLKRGYEPRELAKAVGLFVNNFGVDKKGFVDAVISNADADKNFKKIAAAWVLSLAKMKEEPHTYDDRNKYSVEKGSKLAKLPELEELWNETNYDGENRYSTSITNWSYNHKQEMDMAGQFAFEFQNEHRTLQQTFSSIVFMYLNKKYPGLEEKMESQSWFNAPLI